MTTVATNTVVVVPTSALRGGDWARLMWGFFWRGVVYTLGVAVAGGVVGGVVGGVLGGVLGATGTSSVEQIGRIAGVLGVVLGLAVAILGLRLYIAWLLAARYGSLRLALFRDGGV
jgi:hypothetical protein